MSNQPRSYTRKKQTNSGIFQLSFLQGPNQVCLPSVNVPTVPQTTETSSSRKKSHYLSGVSWKPLQRQRNTFIQPVFKLGSVFNTVGSVVNKATLESKVSCETLPRLNQLPGCGPSTIIQTLEQTVAYIGALTTFCCSNFLLKLLYI